MADPRHHVRPGQTLALAASQVNWINDQMRRTGAAAPSSAGFSAPYTWVYVKNVSGSTVDRWGILAITGFDITPTATDSAAATKQFQAMPVLTGGTPTATTTAWCVAIEPIANNKIGKAAVAGAVQIRAADIGKASGAQLIFRNSSWALIVIGGGLRLGTISATWTKGTTATVTEQFGDGTQKTGSPTFTATNYFSTVTVSSGIRRVACGKVDDKWLLIAAEC